MPYTLYLKTNIGIDFIFMRYKTKGNAFSYYWLFKQECDLVSRIHDSHYKGINRFFNHQNN